MTDKRTKILDEYFEHLKAENRPMMERKSTLMIYFKHLDAEMIDFLRVRIPDAQNFQSTLSMKTNDDCSPYYGTATVISMIGRVTSFYDYLKMRKLIPFNPFREIARLRGEKNLPRDILTEDEMSRALTHLRKFMQGTKSSEKRMLYKAHLIAELMYSTGARIHEIARLTFSDLDLSRGLVVLRDSKTGVERRGILNEYTLNVFRLYVEKTRPYVLTAKSDNEFLFGSHNHIRRWINDMMIEAIKKTAGSKRKEKLTKHFTSHSFRHSMASHLLKNGCDIRYIQELLGHESIGSTQIYTRVVKEDLRGIIDMYHPRSLKKHEGLVLSEVEA